MKNKALIFVYNKKSKKFLLLNSKSKWITLTLTINDEEYTSDRLVQEIKDTLGIIPEEVFSLNWGSIQKINGEEFKVMNFIAFVNSYKESLRYKWFTLDEFIDKINWKDNKILLKKVLTKGINKEVYFDKKERGN